MESKIRLDARVKKGRKKSNYILLLGIRDGLLFSSF